MTTVKFKQFGIQRSGTNYIRQLMLDNIENIVFYEHQFGRKHARPLTEKKLGEWAAKRGHKPITKEDNVHPIIIIKNPYSWYQSIKQYKKSKFDFVKAYTKYNKLYKTYKELYINGHSVFGDGYIIQYETLLSNPRKEIAKIATRFGGAMRKKFKTPGAVIMSTKFTPERKKFYLSEGNFDLGPDMIKKITDIIDWETIGFYGYKIKK